MCSKDEDSVLFRNTSYFGLHLTSWSQANSKLSRPLPALRLEGSVPETPSITRSKWCRPTIWWNAPPNHHMWHKPHYETCSMGWFLTYSWQNRNGLWQWFSHTHPSTIHFYSSSAKFMCQTHLSELDKHDNGKSCIMYNWFSTKTI